jgi:hypothetical protein
MERRPLKEAEASMKAADEARRRAGGRLDVLLRDVADDGTPQRTDCKFHEWKIIAHTSILRSARSCVRSAPIKRGI